MKIVVSGSTGLIGSALIDALRGRRRDHEIVPLVRRPVSPGEHAIAWDPERGAIDRAGLEGTDAVIHLAGENVFGRWSAAKKQRIYDSRVKGTRLVSDALAGLHRPPATLLAASAAATRAGIRVVNMRMGVVLTTTGGALAKMLPAFRLGLGGPVGSGNQYLSWIALADVLNAILHLLERPDLVGPVNMTAAAPITNREFARA